MGKQLRLWWQAKQGTWMRQRIGLGAHTLGKRSVFILPTLQGFYLAFFLLAMLLACINYNLSLGYMLTFFVFSVALGAMHRTHQNLVGTGLEVLPCEPVYAGQAVTLRIQISNTSGLNKYSLLATKTPVSRTKQELFTGTASINSLASKEMAVLTMPLPPLARGIHPMPALEMSSLYPLGLWRAWSYVFGVGDIVVYPQPQSPLPHLNVLPQQSLLAAHFFASSRDLQGDAVSHIEPTDTATVRSIHWPALAKGQLAQRVLEHDTQSIAQGVLLSLAGCTVAGIEAQLSQLCFAIEHCAARNLPFVMQLGGVSYPSSEQASSAPAHVQQCLHALAAYGA